MFLVKMQESVTILKFWKSLSVFTNLHMQLFVYHNIL